jgi:Right handed beta helix region
MSAKMKNIPNNITIFRRIALLTVVLTTIGIGIGLAEAAQRTFVASYGADANTAASCSLLLPCRGFAAAQTVTDSNGEIIVLDSAGYGPVTITKSLSISAPTGVYAGISVLSGNNGISIPFPGVNVVLRGLNINGLGGNNGILSSAGNKLTVENCVISNLTGNGISVTGDTSIQIADTIIRDNNIYGVSLQNGARATIVRTNLNGNTQAGLKLLGALAATTTTVDVADSLVDGSAIGVDASSENSTAVVKLSVSRSSVVNNVSYGFSMYSASGAAVTLSASKNIVANNAFGIVAVNSGTKVWVNGNTISGNSNTGFFNNAALFESAGNNALPYNETDTSGAITVITTR